MSEKTEIIFNRFNIVLAVLLVLLDLWGVVWSFHRYGVGRGLIAAFVPPYALYRGVAYLWDEPKWKDNWDEHIESVGSFVITYRIDKTSPEIIKYKNNARKWIRSLSEDKQQKLRSDIENLRNAYIQYYRNGMEDLLSCNDLRSITDSSIQLIVDRFIHEQRLKSVWNKIESQAQIDRSAFDFFQDEIPKEKLLNYITDINNKFILELEVIETSTRVAIEELFITEQYK